MTVLSAADRSSTRSMGNSLSSSVSQRVNAAGRARTCEVMPLKDLDLQLIEQWSSIVRSRSLNPSLHPAWIRLGCDVLGEGVQPLVYLERDTNSGVLLGLVPFSRATARTYGLVTSVVRLLSNFVAYHPDLIRPEGEDDAKLVYRFLDHIDPWDIFEVVSCEATGTLACAVRKVAAHRGANVQVLKGDTSPYLSLPATWTDLIAGKDKKFRYKVRKRSELIQRDGYRLEWFTQPVQAADLLDAMLAIERRSWKAELGRDISSRPNEIEYHLRLIPWLAQQGMLIACVLYVGESPAAYCLCCHEGRWIGNLKTSFDESFADDSPGSVVIDACIERSFALGATEFDFLGDSGPHKRAWTSAARVHESLFVFGPTIKGRAIGVIKRIRQALARRSKVAPDEGRLVD